MALEEVVAAIEARQRAHPPLAGLPLAARVLRLPLFVGEAGAAADSAFLAAHGIGAVLSVGAGDVAAQPMAVLCVDVLDLEDELLLPLLGDCLAFIAAQASPVLVHCVYGQSRSAAVCVAHLMAAHRMSLQDAYDAVQQARPCIHINAGFLRQLALFERMGADCNIMGTTPAHAELRTMIAARDRRRVGAAAEIHGVPQLAAPRRTIHCRKCRFLLATTRNELAHGVAGAVSHSSVGASAKACAALYVEPMAWMVGSCDGLASKEGKLACPSCNSKIGSWSWMGVKCQCRNFVSPAFQLVPSRVDLKS